MTAMNNTDYQPLRIVHPSPPNGWRVDPKHVKSRFLRRILGILDCIDSKVPYLSLYPHRKPQSVRDIEIQLKGRPIFPTDNWAKISDQTEKIESLLNSISLELFWPNCNFIPNDNLRLVFYTADNLTLSWICNDIGEIFGVTVSPDQIYDMAEADWTIGEFISHIINDLENQGVPE